MSRSEFMEGYATGEAERIALATANSELRSRLRGDHRLVELLARYDDLAGEREIVRGLYDEADSAGCLDLAVAYEDAEDAALERYQKVDDLLDAIVKVLREN